MTGNKGPEDYRRDTAGIIWWTLKYRTPIPTTSILKIDRLIRNLNKRRVRYHLLNKHVSVSTVFLMIAHGHDQIGNPFIFETAIITDNEFNIVARTTTWRNALHVHRKAILIAKQSIKLK